MFDFVITECWMSGESILQYALILKKKNRKKIWVLAKLEFLHCELVGHQPELTTPDLEPHASQNIFFFSYVTLFLFSPCDMFSSADIRPALGSRGWHLVSQRGAILLHCSHGDGCACVHHISLLQAAVIVALCRVQESKWKGRRCCEWTALTPLPSGCACGMHMASLWIELGDNWGVASWGDLAGSWCSQPRLVLIELLCLD